MADHSIAPRRATVVDTAKTFAINAAAAREYRGVPGFAEMCRLAAIRGYSMDPAHLGRLMRGENEPGITYIAGIAAALDFRPWQLLVPGFSPANPPRILTTKQAAILDQLGKDAGGQ